jgi:pimeloyl-ACP methyl ester carboxylesterase
MNLAGRRVAVRGLGIHCLTAGKDGSFVLLLHGGGTDSASLSWGPVIGALAAEHCIYAPDWPGYGESDRPHISYTMSWYVAFLRDLMDALAIERAALVGVSMGGGIALGFAQAWPARVSKLVLVDSYGLQSRAPRHNLGYVLTRLAPLNAATWALMARSCAMVRASLAGIFHDETAISETLVDEVWAEVRKPDAGYAFRSFQRNEVQWGRLRTVYIDRLREMHTSTLIIHGAEDRLVPAACAIEAHRLVKGSQMELLPSCGHWPQREEPEAFNRILLGFLSREAS